MFFQKKESTFPIPPKLVIRMLVVILFLLSLVAGYYYTKYGELQKNYQKLNLKYQATQGIYP